MRIEHITYAYPGRVPLFEDFTLSIDTRSHVALMGPSGVGKSTLARLIKGILAPDSGHIMCGDDSNGFADDPEKRMTQVGLVFQNPDNTMVATTVETELAFGLENMGVPYDEMSRRVTDTLDQFNLAEYRHTSPSHLSGGEKQRLALASVMIMRPDVLILDEPTALLDQPSRRRVMDMLGTLAEDHTTILHITPFTEEALAADRIIVLDNDGCIADGSPQEVMPYLKGFRSCLFPVRFADNTRPVPAVSNTESEKISVHVEEGGQTQPVLTFDQAGFVYEPGTPFAHRALADVCVSVPRGRATTVLGPSGSGKSTLLELAAGLTSPTEGAVITSSKLIRAMAFQLPEDQMFGTDVGAYASFGPRNLGLSEDAIEMQVADALNAVGLDPMFYRDRDPLTLSGGEQRLVALAGVLAMQPDVLVLDEPTAGLDRAGMLRVIDVLQGYVQNGGTLLFSTHDGEVAYELAGYAIVLVDGQVETMGEYSEVLEQSAWLTKLSQETHG